MEHKPNTKSGTQAKHPVRSKKGGVKQAAASTPLTSVQQGDPESGGETRRLEIALRWEGALFSWHSLAHVNRELCLQLAKSEKVELSLVPTEANAFAPEAKPRFRALTDRIFKPLSHPASVHVRHQFPPRFTPPAEGRLVLIQPWEFGSLPAHWVQPIRENVAEVWCYSRYVKEIYLAAGIPEEQLQIVPLGVDTDVFTPIAPPYIFTTEPGARRAFGGKAQPFVFLFVGGTLHRKGIDILLDAYLRAFSAYDNVCLVVKDTGTDTVYRGMNQKERLLQLAEDPNRPALVYLDADLPTHQLAGLYTAADAIVLPYRGEGFCLPALEAMSCGRPVLVTAGGPTDDFVDETVGWRLPAQKVFLPDNRIGEWECVDRPWLLEVDPDALAHQMRQIVQQREELLRRGEAGAHRVRQSWTWQHAAECAQERLKAISALAPPPSSASVRLASSSAAPALLTEPEPLPAIHKKAAAGMEASNPHSSEGTTWQRPRLSLCMIVKNEERVLADCLKSAMPYMDEVIVVDTGSTDRTVEIAQGLGARVEHFPWCDDFSAARNESLKYATGDWILWLDADDTLPPESGEAIRQAMLSAPPEIVGFVIPVQFVENGSSAAGTRVDHLKLFRNLPGLAFEGRIHEQIVGCLRRTGGQFARCGAVVLHTNYDISPEGQARKRERDNRILALELQERPDHPFVLFNLGMTDHFGGAHEAAIAWFRKCLAVAAPSDSIVRKAYALLALSLRELGLSEESFQTLHTGISVTPEDPELLFHLAQQFSQRGRLAEARAHYERILTADIAEHFSSIDMGILGYKTYHNLGGVCLLLGDYGAARHWWQQSIAEAPQFLPTAYDLFNAALEAGDYPTAQQMLQLVEGKEGSSLNLTLMTAKYSLARGEKGQAETTLKHAIATDAGAAAPRLALARHLLQEERIDEAAEHLVTLSEAGNAEAAFYLGVAAIRADDYPAALAWMQRAQQLNPDHEATRTQIAQLQQALAQESTDGQ